MFGSVDRIQEAIALKRRISFVYFKYDAAKRKAPQHNGERYIETPVQLVYAEGYYYLVVFNEKHDDFANYRVDRMDRIEVLDEPALKNERIATFDARELESRAFAFAELQLLVDAVQSSRFLTQRKSDALVEGVKQLASRRQRALLDKRVHVEGRIKM